MGPEIKTHTLILTHTHILTHYVRRAHTQKTHTFIKLAHASMHILYTCFSEQQASTIKDCEELMESAREKVRDNTCVCGCVGVFMLKGSRVREGGASSCVLGHH